MSVGKKENKRGPTRIRNESRWPPALVLLVTVFLLGVLPGRVKVIPFWVSCVAALVVIVTMSAVALTRGNIRWLRTERGLIVVVSGVYIANTIAELADMVGIVTLHFSAMSSYSLLSSSVAIWVANVLWFSLLFWQVDRGGPYGRACGFRPRHDWVFPQPPTPEDLPPDWQPEFLDYLFLAYNTATAFSPTDALPLTRRAKLLMLIESAISLMTMVIVLSRAISVLPS
jgi:hypothetical protein